MSLEAHATTAPAVEQTTPQPRHSRWVRSTHWVVTIAFAILAFTGFIILRAHPRLYWGEAGNDLTPALLELPISRNYKHGGWTNTTPFFAQADSPVSASRTIGIYNQNSWGRSLHFLSAWILVLTGIAYFLPGIISGHFRRNLLPGKNELSTQGLWTDFKEHLRFKIRSATGGPQYGLLQKLSYFIVIFIALPLTGITGLAMSPAVTASYPFVSGAFGGFQSARTIHFVLSLLLALFLIVHVLMIILSGFKRQMRAMTIGE
ncbi:MAG TPA: cytochrome b/b6 domain-containing protein [Verrucomicrobiae bacterium]